MTPDEMLDELAAGLRDVIREAPESYLVDNPEDAFADLACRLVLRLSGAITFMPKLDAEQSAHKKLPAITAAVRALLDSLPPCTAPQCWRTAVIGRDMCADHGGYTSSSQHRFAEARKRIEELGIERTNGVQK
jgi:hypothetical protein